jgi:hypothetical protein
LTLPLDIAHVANHNILHYICEFPVAPVHNIVSPNQIKQRAIKLDEIIAISLVPNSEIYAAKLSSCQATPKKSIVAGEDGRGHCATCLRKKKHEPGARSFRIALAYLFHLKRSDWTYFTNLTLRQAS